MRVVESFQDSEDGGEDDIRHIRQTKKKKPCIYAGQSGYRICMPRWWWLLGWCPLRGASLALLYTQARCLFSFRRCQKCPRRILEKVCLAGCRD